MNSIHVLRNPQKAAHSMTSLMMNDMNGKQERRNGDKVTDTTLGRIDLIHRSQAMNNPPRPYTHSLAF